MIKFEHVYHTYVQKKDQLTALTDINLHIKKGEIFGVIGTSGAGKSTLIRCINLLERPSSGKIWINNQDMTSLSSHDLRLARQKIGMIFQHFNLLSSRTVYDNIALPLKLIGKNKQEIATKVNALLALVALSDKKDFYPSQLSGGQKQRVAIARALVTDPDVLLCDEATSALDPQTTHAILQLLKDINATFNLTILLITHEMNVIKEICHRLGVIEKGKIVEESDVIKFFGQPETQFAKAFIRSTFKNHLPESLQERIVEEKTVDTFPLIQISFFGSAANEAIIAQLIQLFKVNLSILQANIEHIREEMVGTMIIELAADETRTQECINYLSQKGLHVEIIGYVKRNN